MPKNQDPPAETPIFPSTRNDDTIWENIRDVDKKEVDDYINRIEDARQRQRYIEVEGNAYFLSFKDKSNDDVMILRSVA